MVVSSGISAAHQQQLRARGLDPALAARLGWTSASHLGGSLSIPYVCDGEVVNHKYRTLSGVKRFAQDENAKKCLWNCDVLKDETLVEEPLVITEGELDALTAIQCGYKRVVSVPDGAPAHPLGGGEGPKYSYLTEAMPVLRTIKEIILATDGDGPGNNLLHDLALRLGRAACKFLIYPFRKDKPKERCKDLNEVLLVYGAKGVTATLKGAKWLELPGLYRMSELPPLPEQPTMDIGMDKTIDTHMKARRGDFWVVTGMPGHGKTAFVTDMMCHLAMNHKLKIAWGSFENRPQQDLKKQLRKWHIAWQRFDNFGTDADQGALWESHEIAEADAWIEDHFVFMVPTEDENLTVEWALERAKAAVVRYDCDVMVLDPWNELSADRPSEMTQTEFVGEAIKAIKRMAVALQILWIVVAHPTKLRQGEVAGLGTISDSAHWNNKADIGIVLSRPDDEGNTELRIQKVRYEEIGKRGTISMRFNHVTRRFYVPFEIGGA